MGTSCSAGITEFAVMQTTAVVVQLFLSVVELEKQFNCSFLKMSEPPFKKMLDLVIVLLSVVAFRM